MKSFHVAINAMRKITRVLIGEPYMGENLREEHNIEKVDRECLPTEVIF